MTTLPYNNKPTDDIIRYRKLVSEMQQKALEEFDFDAIFQANQNVRNFFEKWDNKEGMKLVDRMTNVMKNLKVLVDFVKAQKISFEMGKKELEEFRTEIAEIGHTLDTLLML